ncbi:hypothetical protein V5O48_012200 [Marasmius crinis-equi]|uniref:Uncharacterized protein n=1 Tax=Marasmius crinis-equi TaxID=585013 RepID=A0ABR3F3J5_9AGAR
MFSPAVKEAQCAYWGPWYDKDLNLIPDDSLPSYNNVFKLLGRVCIIGFGSGSVTQMQVANYFAIEGLCQHLTAENMAMITAENEKGALKGLLKLGFSIQNALPDTISLAFRCMYDFLDHHLSSEDKKTLGFNAIFVKHLLCKISRWDNILTRANLLKELNHLLEEAKQDTEHWKQRGFSIPLHCNQEELSTLVAKKRLKKAIWTILGVVVTHSASLK